MNYINLINSFWRNNGEHSLNGSATSLYFFLMHSCNSLGWKSSFRHSDRYLSARLGLSINTVRTAKIKLKEMGLINFVVDSEKGGRGYQNTTRYILTPPKMIVKSESFEHENAVKTDSINGGFDENDSKNVHQYMSKSISKNDFNGSNMSKIDHFQNVSTVKERIKIESKIDNNIKLNSNNITYREIYKEKKDKKKEILELIFTEIKNIRAELGSLKHTTEELSKRLEKLEEKEKKSCGKKKEKEASSWISTRGLESKTDFKGSNEPNSEGFGSGWDKNTDLEKSGLKTAHLEVKTEKPEKPEEKEHKQNQEKLVMPDSFRPIWRDYLEYRTAKKKKPYAGPKFEQMAVNNLLGLSNNNPEIGRKILEQTIIRNWDGLFELKENIYIKKTNFNNSQNGQPNFSNTNNQYTGNSRNTKGRPSGKISANTFFARKLSAEFYKNNQSKDITALTEILQSGGNTAICV